MQIRRLHHVNGQYGIFGRIINVPVSVNTMVNRLPRNVDDENYTNVHIKRKKIHKSSYVMVLVNKCTIKTSLQYLTTNFFYRLYEIIIDKSFFDITENVKNIAQDNILENITMEDSLTTQQQTLLWNNDSYLRILPERNVAQSILFDEHVEELYFLAIYLSQFREFYKGVHVTPFMMATRRSD